MRDLSKNMSLLKKLTIVTTIATSLATPSFTTQQPTNPFLEPNQSTTTSYGSGDVNSDGKIDQIDCDLVQSGIQNDMADIDINKVPSEANDKIILNGHLEFGKYLPRNWNKLETREQKKDLVDKMFEIDETKDETYIFPEQDCNFFTNQTYINFHGYNGDIPDKFDATNNQRFNIPLYTVTALNRNQPIGHTVVSILIGDNPLNYNDWYFIEPQTGKEIKLGDVNFDKDNNEVWIGKIKRMTNNGTWKDYLLKYSINEGVNNGEPVLMWYDTLNLVIDKNPVVSVEENPIIAKEFLLNQNYPNPFNAETNIEFNLGKPCLVDLDIYDVKGQLVKDFEAQTYFAGKHKIRWNGENDLGQKVSSGVYLYRMQAGKDFKTRKMTVVK